MIIVFIGPPFAGKDTQAKLLSESLGIPAVSMGALIRQAYEEKNPKAIEGFEHYSLKGLHVPNALKFDFLKEKMEEVNYNVILDNYPATQEDLDTLLPYIHAHNVDIDTVIYLTLSAGEMQKRLIARGRPDDTLEIVTKRRENQDKDREPVVEHFRKAGKLIEINGEKDIQTIHQVILQKVKAV